MSRTILVVEDDPTIGELLKLHLASARRGYEITLVSNGEEAIRCLSAGHIVNLVLCDISMPGMDGFSVLNVLKNDPRWRHIPVILMTAMNHPDYLRKGIDMGAADFLHKPIKREDLLNAVRTRLKLLSTDELLLKNKGREDDLSLPPPAEPIHEFKATQSYSPIDRNARDNESLIRPLRPIVRSPLREEKKANSPQGVPLQGRKTGRWEEWAAQAASKKTTENPHGNGERINGAVLVLDIRNSTTLWEILSPEQALEILNAYFSGACKPVIDQGGWIPKFTGDGFIALFEGKDCAERALRASTLMMIAAQSFRKWLKKQQGKLSLNTEDGGSENNNELKILPTFSIGVGVHIGSMLLGKIRGMDDDSNYTILGNTINITTRLQEITKTLGWSIVASKEVSLSAGNRFLIGEQGQTILRGRSKAIDIVEILGMVPRPGSDAIFYENMGASITENAAIIKKAKINAEKQDKHPSNPKDQHSTESHSGLTNSNRGNNFISIPGYQVIRQIGQGGTAQVLLALHLASNSERVLKIIQKQQHDPEQLKRLQREFQMLAAVDHPHIAHFYEQGETKEHAYLAMEYLPRGSLRPFIDKMGYLPLFIINALRQLTLALKTIHALGIVHCDIKPDNIMMRNEDTLVLTDFGIAKHPERTSNLTHIGIVNGTPNYLSPEQAIGDPVTPSSDIYSLGIVAYEMLTGETPFHSGDVESFLYRHAYMSVPPLPSTYSKWQGLIDKMLAKKPAERFASADELLSFLDTISVDPPDSNQPKT